MQDVPDHQPQADSRASTFDQVIPAPAQRVDHHDLEEMHRWRQAARRLAQKYHIDFDENTDPVAVLQEVERRARSSRKRSSGRIFSFASLRDAFASVFKFVKTDAEELKRPRRFGSAVPVPQQSIPHGSAAPDPQQSISHGSAAPVPQQSIPSESRSLIEDVRYDVGRYQFWAVLIGIDAYTQDPLRGCVSDALLIKHFLTDDLGVPENRIQCLLGSKDPNFAGPMSTPSRANIIDTLYSLVNNPEITRGDNIIIYYAGHGSRYCCTEHDFECRCDNCPIEALCPIDRDTQDADGNWIPDISDRELNSLFALICRAKGQNITFIADCCHSGGMSRGQRRGIRSTALTYNASLKSMLHAADERWKDSPGYRSVLSKDWRPDMDSHVILAACQSNQTAQEVAGNNGFGGVFSKEFVRVLRSTDCKEGTTYADLIPLLNQLPYGQVPLVDGTRTLKPIFYRSRFWAVLIGIDAYTEYPLRGCVSDALFIKYFLTDDLGVPENHIKCLLSSKDPDPPDPKSTPSRANIIDTLYSLAINPEIGPGDNIIIYYAGHSSRYCCTEHDFECRCDNCPIEALCPIDRDTQDADGNWIPDISDRELDILIGLICRAKGHKITFIVDAGYSGRTHRGQGAIGTFTELKSMLHAADERWKDFPGYRSVLSKDWRQDMNSHVTLAYARGPANARVCSFLGVLSFMDELRGYGSYNGIFTEALLHVLRSTDWEEMTCVDLIKLMSKLLPPEHPPFVSGKRMNERLWN
ncbi:uncharacterized protein ARMOST_04396 [Armillaria ostoyae]|uniref:Peptidase C14 caspase domain-containing protein n=1 Tax=Armillaria ostoyae TaxID=47428 RepID=A0A284QX84_ARMOS|nr:uncharacterized protein ARMOST_04396 [Armillaria ostoyae]